MESFVENHSSYLSSICKEYFSFIDFAADPVRSVQVPQCLTKQEFEQFLEGQYPGLRNIKFDLCRVDRYRVVRQLTEDTPRRIRSTGALGRSALYLRPSVSSQNVWKAKVHSSPIAFVL